MRARSFNKRVQIWQTSYVSDGFSGTKTFGQIISNSWAKVETAKSNASNMNEIGLDDMALNLLITVRYRNDLEYNGINQYLVYNGVRYEFSQAPNENNLNRTFVKLIAIRQKQEEVAGLEPINPDSNMVFLNYKSRVESEDGVFEAEQCTKEFIDKLI